MAFTPTSWTNGSGAAINATNLNNVSNALAQNVDYQLATVVSQQIRITRYSPSDIFKFRLASAVTGGAITISTDAGATSIALKNGAGEAVAELEPGLYEVAYVTPFFILRSSGGLGDFFGDGSDGTVANLTTSVTAPNGGTVASLVDASTGTSFVTSSLGAGADVVAFTMDLGKPHFMKAWRLWQASVSTNRTYAIQSSTDGSAWTQRATQAITTTPTDYTISIASISARYWRLVTTAGTAGTITIRNLAVNFGTNTPATTDTETSLTMRILEQSTLNGAAVIKQYTTYSLPDKYEHTVENPNQGLVVYYQNTFTNAGVIDMSQKAGLAPNGNIIPMLITNFKTFDPYGIQKFYELTTKLEILKGGAGGNGGTGGTSNGGTGGAGGAGRQNAGGFGGGGGGGGADGVIGGGTGGAVTVAEIGGGQNDTHRMTLTGTGSSHNSKGKNGYNGAGGTGAVASSAIGFMESGATGKCNGGGSGGSGASTQTNGATTATAATQFAGGLFLAIGKGNFVNTGTIKSNGGVGGNGSNGIQTGIGAGGGGGGGGAGGGVIAFAHGGTANNTGTIQANGGAGGTAGTTTSGTAATNGASGSVGTIADIQL